jgi:hypothetical protein
VPHNRSESRETGIDGTRAAGSDDWRMWQGSGRADPSRAETMSGWAGATAQQACADETGAALGRAPWLKCETSVGQQLLQRSNAQATVGRSPTRRLAQTRRIAVYRRITTCRPRSLAPDNPATRHVVCRGALCTFPRNQGSKSVPVAEDRTKSEQYSTEDAQDLPGCHLSKHPLRLAHRGGLSPPTPCRSPGAQRLDFSGGAACPKGYVLYRTKGEPLVALYFVR